MELIRRQYHRDDDYWRMRALLRDIFLRSDCHEVGWQAARLDYWRCFVNPRIDRYALSDAITLWETNAGQLAACIIPDGRASAYLQVHPDFRSLALEDEMLRTAEERLAEPAADGLQQITAWAHATDALRVSALTERGYERGDWPEYQFRRDLDGDLPDVQPASGYRIRALGDASEIPARSWLSWRVFHPDEPDSGYGGWDWYADIQRCPLYRRDLDLVAEGPNGELAAFCTVWFDDVTRTGMFEPVGVSPDHQRRGLGKAIMVEGLRRLKTIGARYATVAGYSEAALALYGALMTPEPAPYERWTRRFLSSGSRAVNVASPGAL